MRDEALKNILDCDFRSNPGYEVVPLDHMNRVEQEALGGLREDPECFGILRPKPGSGLRIKTVCKESALLFYSLQHGGKLPGPVIRESNGQANQQIVELVLDEVLQLSRNRGFVSGAQAQPLLCPRAPSSDHLGRIARLSVAAVQYAERLPIDDPMRLSGQMYFFNRVPVTPQWRRRIGDAEALARFLGTDSQGRCGPLLRRVWRKVPKTPETEGWDYWTLPRHAARRKAARLDFKIYVSPDLDSLPEMLFTVLEVFAEQEVRSFKIGADLPGLCRPDKIIAYLEDFERLESVVRQLNARLDDCPVQGVPFTAELGKDGLVSWGMDPHEAPVIDWQQRTSWRLWITNRLAGALIDAQLSGDPAVQPWQFALERLRLDGIDTSTWTPTDVYQNKTRN